MPPVPAVLLCMPTCWPHRTTHPSTRQHTSTRPRPPPAARACTAAEVAAGAPVPGRGVRGITTSRRCGSTTAAGPVPAAVARPPEALLPTCSCCRTQLLQPQGAQQPAARRHSYSRLRSNHSSSSCSSCSGSPRGKALRRTTRTHVRVWVATPQRCTACSNRRPQPPAAATRLGLALPRLRLGLPRPHCTAGPFHISSTSRARSSSSSRSSWC